MAAEDEWKERWERGEEGAATPKGEIIAEREKGAAGDSTLGKLAEEKQDDAGCMKTEGGAV